jgi:hypothetical protein
MRVVLTKKRERSAVDLPELLSAVAIKHSELEEMEEGKGNYDDPEQRSEQLDSDLLNFKDAIDAKVGGVRVHLVSRSGRGCNPRMLTAPPRGARGREFSGSYPVRGTPLPPGPPLMPAIPPGIRSRSVSADYITIPSGVLGFTRICIR